MYHFNGPFFGMASPNSVADWSLGAAVVPAAIFLAVAKHLFCAKHLLAHPLDGDGCRDMGVAERRARYGWCKRSILQNKFLTVTPSPNCFAQNRHFFITDSGGGLTCSVVARDPRPENAQIIRIERHHIRAVTGRDAAQPVTEAQEFRRRTRGKA